MSGRSLALCLHQPPTDVGLQVAGPGQLSGLPLSAGEPAPLPAVSPPPEQELMGKVSTVKTATFHQDGPSARKGVFVVFWGKYADGLERVVSSCFREPELADVQKPVLPSLNVTGAPSPSRPRGNHGGSRAVHTETLWPLLMKEPGNGGPQPHLEAPPSCSFTSPVLNSQFVASCPHSAISQAVFPFKCTRSVIY